ncbi:MAG TPA: type I methionyl aminopeptidase [Thermoanaerobaculia bacterium]|jgi:methionyl aminopeptidase|nr:type I methionyl aminopeptidase [Thermoanaerobaculia bacterium]
MSIDSEKDWEGLRRIGRIVRLALEAMKKRVGAGITTGELDEIGAEVLARHGARSAPRLVYDFPRSICISVNDEAVHGIPGDRILAPGDLVKLDTTAEKDGYMADAAVTVAVPPSPARARQLAACAQAAFFKAMKAARAGNRVNDIGRAVEAEVKRHGFSVLRDLSGHGIGRSIHEEPSVPNFYDPYSRQVLTEGLVLAVEPIIAAGARRIVTDRDGWTVRTSDGSLAAHFEHTIVITRGRPVLLTAA